jgi:2-hydroxychromene-2-carboxylate isomerase
MPSPTPIEFYFDFSSPYGYFAAERIDALAARHAREVQWRPYLLGVAFKATGSAPLASIPLKGDYMRRDLPRTARLLGLEYREPENFPISGVHPARAFYWAEGQDASNARALAGALYRAYFAEGLDISDAENTLEVCARCGFDRAAARAGIADPAVKERLRAEVERGLARGVFGSPYIIVDGEPFWGADRLDQVERWLATGGW